jgi:hypothetical protein
MAVNFERLDARRGRNVALPPRTEGLDLALLANPEHAREGYAGIEKYIGNNLPDVIETPRDESSE